MSIVLFLTLVFSIISCSKEKEDNKGVATVLKGHVSDLIRGINISGYKIVLVKSWPYCANFACGTKSEEVGTAYTDINGDYTISFNYKLNEDESYAVSEQYYGVPYYPEYPFGRPKIISGSTNIINIDAWKPVKLKLNIDALNNNNAPLLIRTEFSPDKSLDATESIYEKNLKNTYTLRSKPNSNINIIFWYYTGSNSSLVFVSWKEVQAYIFTLNEAKFNKLHRKRLANYYSLMTKVLVLCTLIIFIPGFAFSQEKKNPSLWHLTIVDNTTNKGIDRVTIAINGTKYFSTDVYGSTSIDKAFIGLEGEVRISSVGYHPVVLFPRSNLNFPDTVKLSTSVTILKEVRVRPGPPAGTTIGVIKKRYNSHRIPNLNEQFAQFIPNENRVKGRIVSVNYVLNDELHGIANPFKVRLYPKSKGSLFPDQELTKDSIIAYNQEKKHRLSIDVSLYDITMPEDGIIAVFETLSPKYYGKDSIWYEKKPFYGRWRRKIPGIEMDLKKKDSYPLDHDKKDRKGPYAMVRPKADILNYEDIKDQFYVFPEGNNFAISITVSPN
ncbi:MAG: hypothetical protein EOP45_03380 [Sphingobacteriaceae bacterium]|nr:MAG: hypothetical protein EOP45_03380 [Sphingobacteriaceae bacterium]